eukprot:scaffold18028_cov22-Prasinocladus_malaysianus.AAC.1
MDAWMGERKHVSSSIGSAPQTISRLVVFLGDLQHGQFHWDSDTEEPDKDDEHAKNHPDVPIVENLEDLWK